jgi:hypothetical protein
MIPTTEIEALAERCRKAVAPLPYQEERLLPKLRCERPVRFAAVDALPCVLVAMLEEVRYSMDSVNSFVGLINDIGAATSAEREMQLPARWPAAQILELCEAVLEMRRPTLTFNADEVEVSFAGERLKSFVPGDSITVSTCTSDGDEWNITRPMARVNAVDGVKAGGFAGWMNRRAHDVECRLDALPYVDSVRIESNHTLEMKGDIPGKSIRITIGPESADYDELKEIAGVIYDETPIGVCLCGDVTVYVDNQPVSWDWETAT